MKRLGKRLSCFMVGHERRERVTDGEASNWSSLPKLVANPQCGGQVARAIGAIPIQSTICPRGLFTDEKAGSRAGQDPRLAAHHLSLS
jgi:hypothetical protein